MNLVSERPVVVANAASSKVWHVLLFALFFVSGFCGLLYQTIWLRLALASFGVVTPVVSVIISVFMLGLGLGSWLAGKYVNEARRLTGLSAMTFYGLVELVIAAGAFAVPACFRIGEQWLLHVGQANSTEYLLWSAIVIASSICLFSTAMGMTFPLVMSFIEELETDDHRSFSFLYVANLAGAVCGTLITALVLIELLGFHLTLSLAALLNVSIAAVALGWAKLRQNKAPSAVRAAREPDQSDEQFVAPALGNCILFVTGFTSMAMEVVWTRQFTEKLGSVVYSFAALLATYLVATCVGSLLYRRDAKRDNIKSIATLLALAGSFALLPALVVSVIPSKLSDHGSIIPFSAVLGYLTPLLIDRLSRGRAAVAGRAYALNVIGCVAGPLVAGYFLLPSYSHRLALIMLAIPYLVLYLWAQHKSATPHRFALAGLLLVSFGLSLVFGGSDEFNSADWQTRRDYVATVSCTGQGMHKRLLVNGVTMTYLTPICKFMAHLPLACRDTKPTKALVICFGMGTTYRSLMSWNIDVTAVELVPSVKDSFAFFHDDADSVLRRSNGRIIIDDGRRFLNRTNELYDVIVIDPPPPVGAAGSSLLYSTDFYRVVRQHLKPGGVLQTWYPNPRGPTLSAVARSLAEAFPHVRCFGSVEGWGYHFLASDEPIYDPTVAQMLERMPPAAIADLFEWMPDGRKMVAAVLSRGVDIHSLFDNHSAKISDDMPFNEYNFLRRISGTRF